MHILYNKQESNPDWNYIVDQLESCYIGIRGVSLIKQAYSEWVNIRNYQTLMISEIFSLINVGLGTKKSAIFNFIFDDIDVIKEISEEISKNR